jgi:hypothetical protein
VLTRYSDIGVTKRVAGRVDPVLSAYLATKLLPQRVKWLVTGDAVVTEPKGQPLEMSLASIVRVCRFRSWRHIRFDNEVTSSSRAEPSKDFQQFRINFHISDRIFRFGMKIACCLNANNSFVPSKSSPF